MEIAAKKVFALGLFGVPITLVSLPYIAYSVYWLDRWDPDLGGQSGNFRVLAGFLLPTWVVIASFLYVGAASVFNMRLNRLETSWVSLVSISAGIAYEIGAVALDVAVGYGDRNRWTWVALVWILAGPLALAGVVRGVASRGRDPKSRPATTIAKR